jgi:hypothetical protein
MLTRLELELGLIVAVSSICVIEHTTYRTVV